MIRFVMPPMHRPAFADSDQIALCSRTVCQAEIRLRGGFSSIVLGASGFSCVRHQLLGSISESGHYQGQRHTRESV